jgi:pimeloyl-ACP methyl ester carboxylesterase
LDQGIFSLDFLIFICRILQKIHTALLAIWGENDPYFIPAGAEAFRRDNPNATVQFVDTGHFALETHVEEIDAAMREFLAKTSGLEGVVV